MTQVTQAVFDQYLRTKKYHNAFVEDGDTLMRKLADLKISRARGCTHAFGFIIPRLDDNTRKAVLKLLGPRKWTATIAQTNVLVDGETLTYAHIKLNA